MRDATITFKITHSNTYPLTKRVGSLYFVRMCVFGCMILGVVIEYLFKFSVHVQLFPWHMLLNNHAYHVLFTNYNFNPDVVLYLSHLPCFFSSFLFSLLNSFDSWIFLVELISTLPFFYVHTPFLIFTYTFNTKIQERDCSYKKMEYISQFSFLFFGSR